VPPQAQSVQFCYYSRLPPPLFAIRALQQVPAVEPGVRRRPPPPTSRLVGAWYKHLGGRLAVLVLGARFGFGGLKSARFWVLCFVHRLQFAVSLPLTTTRTPPRADRRWPITGSGHRRSEASCFVGCCCWTNSRDIYLRALKPACAPPGPIGTVLAIINTSRLPPPLFAIRALQQVPVVPAVEPGVRRRRRPPRPHRGWCMAQAPRR
jgi:hypothetical protein